MNKEELLDCLKKLSKTNNLRDGIDIKKEEANIIVNEIERLEQALQEEKKTTNHAYKLWKSIDNSHIEKIYKLEQEIEMLNNIIEEIREYINIKLLIKYKQDFELIEISHINKILEILDKADKGE